MGVYEWPKHLNQKLARLRTYHVADFRVKLAFMK